MRILQEDDLCYIHIMSRKFFKHLEKFKNCTFLMTRLQQRSKIDCTCATRCYKNLYHTMGTAYPSCWSRISAGVFSHSSVTLQPLRPPQNLLCKRHSSGADLPLNVDEWISAQFSGNRTAEKYVRRVRPTVTSGKSMADRIGKPANDRWTDWNFSLDHLPIK